MRASQNTTNGGTSAVNKRRLAALSFDDGPSNITGDVLDRLEKYGVAATFFLVGNNINDSTSELVKRAHEMNCEIGNHSKTHGCMTEMSAAEITAEIDYTSKEIRRLTGASPVLFRPPYIAVNQLMKSCTELVFIAGCGCSDWEDSVSAQERADRIFAQIDHGGIILMHDAQDNVKTVEALDILIPKLQNQGYRLVTVSQLFEECGVEPDRSKVYTNVFQKSEFA